MLRLMIVICAFLSKSLLGPSSDTIRRYRSIESYEIRPGIVLRPAHLKNGEFCEVTIEKSHFSGGSVNLDAAMSSEEIRLVFDELVPQMERGKSRLGLPEEAELTETNGGIRTTRILYENVSLAMYGKVESQKWIAATIVWNMPSCEETVKKRVSLME